MIMIRPVKYCLCTVAKVNILFRFYFKVVEEKFKMYILLGSI